MRGDGAKSPYVANVYGGTRDRAGRQWQGPRRQTAVEAAQDYCDYVNGLPVIQRPKGRPKRAGHSVTRTTPVARDPEVEAALGVLRDFRAQRRGVQGYVYLITDGEYVKIGYSVNPPKRVAELQTGNARVLSLLGTIKGTEQDERALHAKYAHLNVLQEWFELDSAILAEFGADVNQPAAESGGQPKEATPNT